MQLTELPKFKTVIAALAVTFGREADDALFMGYEMGLSDLSIADISRAAKTAMQTLRFMPTVFELRTLAGVVGPEQRAVIAWGAFAKAVSEHGYYRSVDFDDVVINATVRSLGGWMRVSTVDDPKEFEAFLRKDFERTYLALYLAGVSPEQAAPLAGYYETTNGVLGFPGREFHGVAINDVVKVETGLPAPAVRITGPAPKRLGASDLGVVLKRE